MNLPGFFIFWPQSLYPMKRMYATILVSFFVVSAQFTSAQESDSAIAARNALQYADKIVKANFYQDWKSYLDLSCYSAIKYYGGPEQFKEHIVMMYFRNEPKQEEKPETLRMLELRNDIDQWQCVIEKVRNTFLNDKRAIVYSYLIGQSLDAGVTWKFIDVSHNKVENVVPILPTVFTDLTIPPGKTVFPDEVAAQAAAEEAAKEAAAKAPVKKKATKKR